MIGKYINCYEMKSNIQLLICLGMNRWFIDHLFNCWI